MNVNAILATNFKELNEYILKVPQINVIIHDIETQSEALEEITQTQNIDAIILTDLLRGERGLAEYLELVMQLKDEKTKVFYITKNYDDELLKALAKHEIEYYKPQAQSLDDFLEIITEEKLQKAGKVIVKEKLVVEERVVEKKIPVGFKKLVLTVWDNAEFGCELAYAIAKNTAHSVLLIDADILAPKADIYLNIFRYPEGITTQGIFTDTGLNIVLDAIEKNVFTPQLIREASVSRKDARNLSVLTGNYKLENYELYSATAFKKLIEYAYENYEITILLVNRSIYDEFTFISLKNSDYNIIPAMADYPSIQEFNSYLVYFRDMQQVPLEKSKFVAWEYTRGVSLDERILGEITEGNYIGHISQNTRRAKYRSMKAAFVGHMKEEQYEYFDIMAKLKIVPKRRAIDALMAKIRNIFKLKRRRAYASS